MSVIIIILLNVVTVIFQDGVEEVKQHKWFKGIDWDAVLQRKLQVCSMLLF